MCEGPNEEEGREAERREEDRETGAIGEWPRPIRFRHVLAWITATYSVQEQQTNGVSEPMHEQELIIGADDWRLIKFKIHWNNNLNLSFLVPWMDIPALQCSKL